MLPTQQTPKLYPEEWWINWPPLGSVRKIQGQAVSGQEGKVSDTVPFLPLFGHSTAVRNSLGSLIISDTWGPLRPPTIEAWAGLPPSVFLFWSLPGGDRRCPTWDWSQEGKGKRKEVPIHSLTAIYRVAHRNHRLPMNSFPPSKKHQTNASAPREVMWKTEATTSSGKCGQPGNTVLDKGDQTPVLVFFLFFLFFFKYCESQAKYDPRLDDSGPDFTQEFATYTLRKYLSGETKLFFKCQDVLSVMLSLSTKLYTELGSFPF